MRSVNFSYIESTMTTEEKIKNRKIGIIGMARSGLAAATLADNFGGYPFVSDSKDASLLKTETSRLEKSGISYETGGHTEKLLACDYLVVSPGVPLTIDIIKDAKDKGIPVFSEIEFAYWACKNKIIAITGSNGKTTTTTLIGEIFSTAGFETFVGGNIGRPFSEFVTAIPEKGIAILEISNFQLDTIANFKPDTAVILNLTPDHLDRYNSFEDYKKAKYRIAENQSENDSLILNLDDSQIETKNIFGRGEIKYFTAGDSDKASTFIKNDAIWMRKNNEDIKVVNCSDIIIPGPHNLQNAVAATAVANLYDIQAEIIGKVLKSFPGVEHRMENSGKIAGISFVNDSKATNIDSVCYALRSIDTSIFLIAGGRDKGADFTEIIKYGSGKIKGVIAIGEAKDKIFKTLGDDFQVQLTDSLESAVNIAFDLAVPGDTILLSPGCASFDMFVNFEKRGRVFKDAVRMLKESKNGNEAIAQK